MAVYTFVCLNCEKEAQSPAKNAKYCSSKDCQKARKDANRAIYEEKKKAESAPRQEPPKQPSNRNKNLGKKDDIVPLEAEVCVPVVEVTPEERPLRQKEKFKRENVAKSDKKLNYLKDSSADVEWVNDHVYIIRTYSSSKK